MPLLTLIWGVFAYAIMVIGLLPVLTGLNWFTVPFAALGALVSIAVLVLVRGRKNAPAIAALMCNAIALTVGVLRLRGGFGF